MGLALRSMELCLITLKSRYCIKSTPPSQDICVRSSSTSSSDLGKEEEGKFSGFMLGVVGVLRN